MIDVDSASAFSPPPAIFEPADRRGGASPFPRPRHIRPRVTGDASPSSTNTKDIQEATAFKSPAALSSEISARIRLLRIESFLESVPFSESSLTDFEAFYRENSPRKKPAIFLTDTGNIRALWKVGEEQIGLQFLGNREIQFVIFSTRANSKAMNRLAGNIGQGAIMGFARAASVDRLFCS
jgi:hypothetical protein